MLDVKSTLKYKSNQIYQHFWVKSLQLSYMSGILQEQ